MVSHRLRCDPERLKLLLLDRLPRQRQAELARHIETCHSCRQRLEALAADPVLWHEVGQLLRPEPFAQWPTATEGHDSIEPGPATLDFLTPSDDPDKLGRFGPYEIEAVIGSGGMGIVLKGFDQTLNRYVAVKVLAPQWASSAAARRRFAREARAAAAIVHEHVVAIHAVDSAGGMPYLVMPLVVGKSLQQRIRDDGPLQVKEILRVGIQTAAGLTAAHAQGLVHRDVKPANILLENGVERVMITDFGLARTVDDASFTRSGVVAGTPQYMSPEQADDKAVDHRADLFSLGSVLYAMCTGHPPFRAERTMAVLRKICESRPSPIRDVNPEIPKWLVEIVEKLLQKDPAERFQSAAEVVDLLGRHLAHLQHPATVTMPARLRSRFPWKIGRKKTAVMLTATVLLLSVGVLGVTQLASLSRARPTEPISRSTKVAEPKMRLPRAGAPIDASAPDEAFQQQLQSIRAAIGALQERFPQEDDSHAPRDLLSDIAARLDLLQQQVEQRPQSELSESITSIAQRLAVLEDEGNYVPPSARLPIDDSISVIRARLDALEQELHGGWP